MLSFLRQRTATARTLWVMLLLIAVVLRPALVATAEAHEAGHLLQTGHTHAQDGSHGVPADESAADGDSALHTLIHMAHCCGQQVAVLPLLLQGPATLDALPPASLQPAAPPGVRIARPLRPPISG